MLEQLFNLVKEHGQQTVVENTAVPNEHNNDVLAEATKTIGGGLQNIIAGGGLQSIMSLFNGGNNNNGAAAGGGMMSNPIVSMMVGHFMNKLVGKFGMQSGQANGIAQQLIPSVLQSLVSKTNDSGNSQFNINSILQSLTGGGLAPQQAVPAQGGGGFDIGNIISQFTGGGAQQDGQSGGGIADIISKITGGAQQQMQQQQQTQGGGIMDLIKGFIK